MHSGHFFHLFGLVLLRLLGAVAHDWRLEQLVFNLGVALGQAEEGAGVVGVL